MAVTEDALVSLIKTVDKQGVAMNLVCEALRAKDLPTATSWEKLTEKLSQLAPNQRETAFSTLLQQLSDHVLCGHKDMHIFDLEDSEVDEIAESFALISPQPSIFKESFPRVISESQMVTASTAPILTHKISRDNGDISLIFCSCRSDYYKTVYKYSEVSPAVQQSFSDFDSFVTIQKQNYQIFDVVNFRRSMKRLEILIDQPSRLKKDETSSDRCLLLLGALASTCAAMTTRYENNSPMNIYPCINSIYCDKHEGTVKQLGFRAPSKSTKREIVSSNDDLRKEPFHAAGIEKVITITVYDIKVMWSQLLSGSGANAGPGWAHIKTAINSLSQEGAYVRSAEIYATNDNAVISIANKITSHSS